MSHWKEFVFDQKCVPWRVREAVRRWNLGTQYLRLEMKMISPFVLSDIPLEKVYTGGFNGDKSFDFEHTPVDRWHPSYLLKDSPHVKFLQQFKDVPDIYPEMFRETEYFQFGRKDIRIYGCFFGILDENRLIERARIFLKLYRLMRDTVCGRNFIFFPGDAHPRDCFLKVSKIPGSDFYMIREGHHRFAIYYVLGRVKVRARVIGKANIFHSEILQRRELHNKTIALTSGSQ